MMDTTNPLFIASHPQLMIFPFNLWWRHITARFTTKTRTISGGFQSNFFLGLSEEKSAPEPHGLSALLGSALFFSSSKSAIETSFLLISDQTCWCPIWNPGGQQDFGLFRVLVADQSHSSCCLRYVHWWGWMSTVVDRTSGILGCELDAV